MDVRSLLEMPDAVFVVRPGPNGTRRATRTGDYWAVDGLLVSVRVGDTRTSVSLLAGGELNHVALRWKLTFPGTALFLGDHWERGYGDLQWRHRQPERVMPWYFGVHDPASTLSCAAGVRVRPSALCFWTVDEDGVTL